MTGAFWSELNTDGEGTRNNASDRRSVTSAGPFRLASGEEQEIVLAVLWARGNDHLDSITELRQASRTVEAAWMEGLLTEPADVPVPQRAPDLISPGEGAGGQPIDVKLVWESVEDAQSYFLDIAREPTFDSAALESHLVSETSVLLTDLEADAEYFWRVRAVSMSGLGPVSGIRNFSTSDARLNAGNFLPLGTSTNPAFVEIVGPGGADPCAENASPWCSEVDGDPVYFSFNSTGDYVMWNGGGAGPEAVIGGFAPNDYEIRFTENGSFAADTSQGSHFLRVPFELWDIGNVGPFGENESTDDVRLIPVIFSDHGGSCEFGYGEIPDDTFPLQWPGTDRIYAFYPTTTYADWEAQVEPLIEGAPNSCNSDPDRKQPAWDVIDFSVGSPLQNIVFFGNPEGDNFREAGPPQGIVVRLYTTPFGTATPIPSTPAAETGPHEQPMVLWWHTPSSEFISTQVQVSASTDFNEIEFEALVDADHVLVSGLTEGVHFYWRLRTTQDGIRFGEWSDTWSFTAGRVTNVATEEGAEIPQRLTLDQNYPNPFNPSTTIRFGLPEASDATITVYDVLGRRVATILSRALPAGWHEVRWDAGHHASGVYVYDIQAGQRRETRTMLLVR